MNKSKTAEASMLIRKSPETVYNAFIDPAITKEFWFTHGSDKLEVGKEVTWTWEMYNFSSTVIARKLQEFKKIVIEWQGPDSSSTVEFSFKKLPTLGTFVSIEHHGFDKEGDELIDAIKDSTGGFTIVLAGLKAYLEHGINLNLIGDKHPQH